MRRSTLIGAALVGLLAGGLFTATSAAAEPPRVVASILPLAGIAAAVMDGVGEPAVLLEPGASPHAYSLRPSEAQALATADLILWVGEGMETFLAGPLEALSSNARVVELAEVAGLALLPYREGTVFDAHTDDHGDDHEESHGGDEHADAHGNIDFHLWLSPANGRAMAAAIAEALAELDPPHAERYAENVEAFGRSLDAAEAEIEALVEPVRGRPFLVFHDAYHYFEAHFGIEASGAVHVLPGVEPGAGRIAEIQRRLQELEAVCVFVEPQFEPRIIETVTEGVDARSGVLDPVGGHLTLGPETYPRLLLDLARNLATCLDG